MTRAVATFRALDARWTVEASPWWVERIATVFAATQVSDDANEPADLQFRIEGDGPATLTSAGHSLLRDVRVAAVLDRIVWEVNQLAWRANPAAVLVHGGLVERAGRAVLVTGPSGVGKTTLVASLCLRGFGYLSDEIAALGPSGPTAFAKPLSIRPGAQARFGPFAPPADLSELMTSAWYVPLASATANEVAVVVFVDHDDQRSTALRRVPRAEALVRLCDQTPNLAASGAVGFRRLAAMVRGAQSVDLVANDLGLAADLVVDVLESPR